MHLMNISLPLACPPWTALGKTLESKVRKALFTYRMAEEKKLAIAVSGGKDSLTLLYLLHAMAGKGCPNWDLYVIYVDGAFSCGPSITKNFLQSICHKLNIPFIVKSSSKTKQPQQCYSCSRERRRLLFEGALEVGAKTIAMGHHRDDSVQTLLMNLLHKAEFEELSPKISMHEYGITIIRPLVYVQEEEIKNFAQMYGFKRITCQCPIGQNSQRKKTEDLLRYMEKNFPNARNNLFLAGGQYSSKKALSKE